MPDAAADPHATVWSRESRVWRHAHDHHLKRALDAIFSAEARFRFAHRKKTIPSSNGMFAYDDDGREIATCEQNEDGVRLDIATDQRPVTILLRPLGLRSLPLSVVRPERLGYRDSFLRAITAARCAIADALNPELVLTDEDKAAYQRRSLAIIGVCSERSHGRIPEAFAAAPGNAAVCALRRPDGRLGPNLLTRRESLAWGMPTARMVFADQSASGLWNIATAPYSAVSRLDDPVGLASAIRSLPTV